MSFKSEQKTDDDMKQLEETLNAISSNKSQTFEPPLKHPNQLLSSLYCVDPLQTQSSLPPPAVCVYRGIL